MVIDSGGGSGALGGFGDLGQPLGGSADGHDVALVEISDLNTVDERHPVALPVESIGQDDLARGTGHNTGFEVDRGLDLVTDAQVELVRVRPGKRVRLPIGHGHSLPDEGVDR
jgi:hypothetical protein